jgi:hypothetical protein
MPSSIILKRNIAKLEAAIKSKATPKSLKSKLESQLVKSKAELSAINKGTKPKTSSTKSTQTTLEKLKAMVKKKKYGVYQGKNIDLKKDADEGALAVGRRVSKGLKGNQFGDAKSSKGHIYYEYRANRLDVKQPKGKQKYPKLADGGMMAKGGVSSYGTREIPYVVVDTDEITVLREFENYNSATKFLNEYLDNNPDKMGSLSAMSKESWEKESQKYMEDGGMMAKGGELKVSTYHLMPLVMTNDKMMTHKYDYIINYLKEIMKLNHQLKKAEVF